MIFYGSIILTMNYRNIVGRDTTPEELYKLFSESKTDSFKYIKDGCIVYEKEDGNEYEISINDFVKILKQHIELCINDEFTFPLEVFSFIVFTIMNSQKGTKFDIVEDGAITLYQEMKYTSVFNIITRNSFTTCSLESFVVINDNESVTLFDVTSSFDMGNSGKILSVLLD